MPDRTKALIYGHPWCLDLLDGVPLDIEAGTPMHEVADRSVLRHRLPPSERPAGGGLEVLLHGGTPATIERGQTRITLASEADVSREAVAGGARLLVGSHVLLVHVEHAGRFQDVLAGCDELAVWWDVADPPTDAFLTVSDVLDRESLRGAWRGLHLYQHPQRMVEDVELQLARWRHLLMDYSALVAS